MAPIILGLAAAVSLAVIRLGRRLHTLGLVLLVALLGLAGVWLLGERLSAAGWHDIDGWVDCYGYCNAWHVVGALFFWGPPAIAVLLIAAVSIAAIVEARRRRPRGTA